MKRNLFALIVVLGLLAAFGVLPRLAEAQDDAAADGSEPVSVFQAAGPSAASIQGSVDQFRTAVSVPASFRAFSASHLFAVIGGKVTVQ